LKRFLAAVLMLSAICSNADAMIGGPAQTKRERMAQERRAGVRPAAHTVPAKTSANAGIREEIERTYLLEDYAGAERLSRDYLEGPISEAERREVEYLRALCFLKLRRPNESRAILHTLYSSAKTERERARLALALVQSQPLAAPLKYGDTSLNSFELSDVSPKLRRGPLTQKAVEEIPQYSIQVGSFSKEKNARSLMRQLAQAQYQAFLDTSLPSLYRVRVGPLVSHEEAVRLEQLLKKDGYPTKIYP
jgi:cell division septation protein DedD